MDAHVLLKNTLFEKYNLVGKDYCYTEKDGRKGVLLTFPLSAYDIIPTELKLVTEELIFVKKVRGTIDEKKQEIEFTFYYSLPDGKDVSNDITANGNKKYGVICPKGKFYECGYTGHNNLEYWLSERSLISSGSSYKCNFEQNGWVKLTGAAMTDVEFVFTEKLTEYDFDTKDVITLNTFKLTENQVNTMIAYIKSLGRELIHFNYEFYTIVDFPKILEYEDFYEFRRKFSVTDEVEDPSEEIYKSKK